MNQTSRAEGRVGEDDQTTFQNSLWIIYCITIYVNMNYNFQAF